ncbi:MAG: hypothetical protein ACRC5M_02755 [Anaeroplasmataceae bacterium]
MYRMYYITKDSNEIQAWNSNNLKSIKHEKAIIERNSGTAVIFNKTYSKGIDKILECFDKLIKNELGFFEIIDMNDKIENIESGLI